MSCDRTYACMLHGFRFAATGPAELVDAVAARLAEFPMTSVESPDLRFAFRSVEGGEHHRIRRPEEEGRPFYRPAEGEATYFPSLDGCYLDHGSRVRVWCSPASGECRLSVFSGRPEDVWLATHPLLTLPLLEMLKRRGQYAVHAAGVARHGRSLLLPGCSGAGKSTLTIALLRAGFDLLGDDLTLLSTGDGIEAHAFPEQIDLTRETLSFFPGLERRDAARQRPGWPKYQLRASQSLHSKIAWRTVPAAIVFPKIASVAESTLESIGADAAFLELAPSVLLTEMESTRRHLAVLGDLTRAVPAYNLLSGRDFNQTAALLAGLLA